MATLPTYAPAPSPLAPEGLRGRFAVVTGGSAGIGRAVAAELAAAGASVLVASRRPVLGRLEHRALDLASQDSVTAFAEGLVRDGRPIDLLVLNAGVHVPWKTVTTADGVELHWQVNYLSNFQLIDQLLDLCRRSALRRIVYVASEAHRLASLPAAPLLGFWYRYAKSKEAAVTFFLRLAELHRTSPSASSLPATSTRRSTGTRAVCPLVWNALWSRPRATDAVAREILASFDAPAGVYRDRGVPRPPARTCADATRADALWQASLDQLRTRLPGRRAPQPISNYARTFQARGPAVECPATGEELAAVVRRAAEDGRGVRVVGRRHSYNDAFFSPTCMVSLDRLDRVVDLDRDRGTITCEGGISIGAVGRYLDERGFALRYCGNFGQQTLAGALATGTHGYGREGGVMSELVRGATVLTADGRRIHTRDERDLQALRLGLGTLGALVESRRPWSGRDRAGSTWPACRGRSSRRAWTSWRARTSTCASSLIPSTRAPRSTSRSIARPTGRPARPRATSTTALPGRWGCSSPPCDGRRCGPFSAGPWG